MRTKPVDSYPLPAYPTRVEAVSDGTLLAGNLPRAWRGDGPCKGALIFFLALQAAACQGAASPPPPSAPPPAVAGNAAPGPTPESPSQPVGVVTVPAVPDTSPPPSPAGPLSLPAPAGMVVAPIFEHGEGRGATGCVVVSPPVFLSEEEAMTVLREELARNGIRLSGTGVRFPDVVIPQQRDRYERTPAGEHRRVTEEVPGSGKPLDVDATDAEGRIAVEFVSQKDYYDVGGAMSGSSVQSYDLKTAAAKVAEKVKQSRRGLYFGVFYDPVVSMDIDRSGRGVPLDWEAEQSRLAKESKALLRAQVADFVAWLRGQGIQ